MWLYFLPNYMMLQLNLLKMSQKKIRNVVILVCFIE